MNLKPERNTAPVRWLLSRTICTVCGNSAEESPEGSMIFLHGKLDLLMIVWKTKRESEILQRAIRDIIPVTCNQKYLLFPTGFFGQERYAQENDLTALIKLLPEYHSQTSVDACKSYQRAEMPWKNITEDRKCVENKQQRGEKK